MPDFSSIMPKISTAILLAVREVWSLAALGYAGEPRLKVLKQQIRWSFAATVNSKELLEWFRDLETPELKKYAALNRRLALKPMRVYVSNRWKIGEKIKILTDTYHFIDRFGTPLQNALTRAGGVNLATFAINGECDACVLLGYDNTYRKEGEMVVSLWCPELGGSIISLVFSFGCRQDGEWTMYIGCIQGGAEVDTKPISKAMHGLWPKAFIVYVAQEIASAVGVKYLLGVSNTIHSHKKKHIVHISTLHEFTFDYDALWSDVDGKLADDGWFDVPLQLERRSYESMKSNKRAMYTRRYAMLDDISRQIRTYLLPNNSSPM